MNRRNLLIRLLGLAAALLPIASGAQPEWPAKTIKLVVPFTAGSGTDIIARAVAERLAVALGQPVVIENKTGAGGTIAANQVAKSAADGYTFLVHSSGHVVNPALYPSLPYDTLRDLSGVTALASLPNVLVVSPAKGYRDVRDLIAKVKANPDAFNFGSAGNGSATHINAEKFRLAAGINPTHIPYRGTPEALTEVIGGRIDWFFAPIVSALPLIRDGKLQAIAVGTTRRSDDLPTVPTIVEAGAPGSEYTFWVGLFAPAQTPRVIIDRLNIEIVRILELRDFAAKLDAMGANPMPMGVAAFDTFVRHETESAARLVKAAGIKVN